MTRDELREYVVGEMARLLTETGQQCNPEDMVSIAYNRGIDDAAEEIGWVDADINRENVLSLKI